MDSFNRQVAYKLWIKDLIEGTYVKEEGLRPNYVLLSDGRRVSRVNLIGTIVSVTTETHPSILLDDGTGKILVRAFENQELLARVSQGQQVFVIGRPRSFGGEMYVIPEIIKPVQDPGWIAVRKAEIELKTQDKGFSETSLESDGMRARVAELVRALDNGAGASKEEILAQLPNCEKVINHLLQNGELFEVSPGRVKILE